MLSFTGILTLILTFCSRSILIHGRTSLVAMQLLDFVDWNVIEVLHDLFVSLNDFLLIFWLGDVLSRGGLYFMLAWLPWLERKLAREVLL